MDVHEYKKELAEWKKVHLHYYNEYVHAIKSREATLFCLYDIAQISQLTKICKG